MITQRTIRNVGFAITTQKIYSTSCLRVAIFQQAFTYQCVTMKYPKCYTTPLSSRDEMTINMSYPVQYGLTKILKYGGDTLIKTVPTVPHNKHDIVVWKENENKCFIIDICVPLDENVHKQENMKIDHYTLLTVGLHRLYPNSSYEVVPIVHDEIVQ